MNVQLLIDSIVRQVTVLIAQLATSGGIRAPVAHIANQVFVELSNELAAQGVSRKVSADMFGMALRAYIRKLRRLTESNTERGTTLWQSLLERIRSNNMVSRTQLLDAFARDDEVQVTSILHDLVEAGLVFCSGSGANAVYRAASDEELGELSRLSSEQGLDELLWAIVFNTGPVTRNQLATETSRPLESLAAPLQRLLDAQRVQALTDGRLHASQFVIPLGAASGWEAAVFHHLQAVVQTICQRLRNATEEAETRDWIGGSTYVFSVWNGHPLEQEVQSQLQAIRERFGQLRQKVTEFNTKNGLPPRYYQVTTYLGQTAIERDLEPRQDGMGEPAAS